MARPNYTIKTLDLNVGRDRGRLVDDGVKYNAVTVLSIPGGAVASLHFGEGAEGVPILGAGISTNVSGEGPDGCPVPADEGLFLTNPSGGAGSLVILISFGGLFISSGV